MMKKLILLLSLIFGFLLFFSSCEKNILENGNNTSPSSTFNDKIDETDIIHSSPQQIEVNGITLPTENSKEFLTKNEPVNLTPLIKKTGVLNLKNNNNEWVFLAG